MRRSLLTLIVATLVLAGMTIAGAGCRKKVAPVPAATRTEPPPATPPAATPAAPTITLSASPAAIERGQSTTLSWTASNATGVTIDNGVGTVEPSGRRSLDPADSTTYMARATGPGGSAVAEARVTVAAPAMATPPPPPALSDIEFFNTNVKDIFFDYDSYEIRDDARTALQSDARALGERGRINFTIEGHCDERGSEKYNLALGDKRANAAKDVLVTQGIRSDRVDTVSYGKERPFCSERNEECWQMNRRAHFVIR